MHVPCETQIVDRFDLSEATGLRRGADSYDRYGKIGLIVGLFALFFAWIPFVGFFSIPLSLGGGLLSAVGIFLNIYLEKDRFGWPIFSLFLNSFAMVIAFARDWSLPHC